MTEKEIAVKKAKVILEELRALVNSLRGFTRLGLGLSATVKLFTILENLVTAIENENK